MAFVVTLCKQPLCLRSARCPANESTAVANLGAVPRSRGHPGLRSQTCSAAATKLKRPGRRAPQLLHTHQQMRTRVRAAPTWPQRLCETLAGLFLHVGRAALHPPPSPARGERGCRHRVGTSHVSPGMHAAAWHA
eukprot:362425-Chlamydomonas_euryale.AAC.5